MNGASTYHHGHCVDALLLHNDRRKLSDALSEMKESSMKQAAFALMSAVALAVVPSALVAKPPLRNVAEIEQPLFAVAMAKEIADHCDSLAARFWKGVAELRRLRTRANELGYSDSEIRAYIGYDEEKARMRAKGETLLANSGVSYEKPETFCAFGRAEIEKNSAIGVLLRAK